MMVSDAAATLETPPPVADGERRPLDPRFVQAQRVARGIAALIIVVAVLPILTAAALLRLGWGPGLLFALGGWVAIVGLLVVWAWVWPPLAWRYASYAVDEAGIEMRRGVIWRRIMRVPRSRVQHTDVSQGPVERSYELGTLVIYTAGTDFARVQLAGLAHDVALRIRDHLLPDSGSDAV